MADKVVITSGRRFQLGDKFAEIRDDGAPVHYVDLILEARQGFGVISLAFGALVIDAENEPLVQVSSRMRMNLATAQSLHKFLGNMITEALKPVDKKKTN